MGVARAESYEPVVIQLDGEAYSEAMEDPEYSKCPIDRPSAGWDPL